MTNQSQKLHVKQTDKYSFGQREESEETQIAIFNMVSAAVEEYCEQSISYLISAREASFRGAARHARTHVWQAEKCIRELLSLTDKMMRLSGGLNV